MVLNELGKPTYEPSDVPEVMYKVFAKQFAKDLEMYNLFKGTTLYDQYGDRIPLDKPMLVSSKPFRVPFRYKEDSNGKP